MYISLQEEYDHKEDMSLISTWSHCAWVTSGCIVIATSLIKSMIGTSQSGFWPITTLAGLVRYVLADLVTGIYHWAIDNYGSASTPIFGYQIEQFQSHHKWPWAITKRQFTNNISTLAQASTLSVLPLLIFCRDPILHGFITTFFGCLMFSQQFHAWAHGARSSLPPLVMTLQDAGVLVSRLEHGSHHRPPFDNNYCIVSGLWNKFLDERKVFLTLERVLFSMFAMRPRSWGTPDADKAEAIDKKLT